ncbi:MAG: hypothetical protein OXF75_12175 [Acidimicrobiaceae bacterium]|nr:hypothetical protein [Acidimicrobiaceae bacterium]
MNKSATDPMVGLACGDSDGVAEDEGTSLVALEASAAAAEALESAEQHQIAEAVYYHDVSEAFQQVAAAADRGDAAEAADLYRKATWHAIAATSGSSLVEAVADYPVPASLTDPSCVEFAHYHPETSCHVHSTRPACQPIHALIYRVHDPDEETGHRYSTVDACPTPQDAAGVIRGASVAVLAWQQAASTANAAAEAWEAFSQTNQ